MKKGTTLAHCFLKITNLSLLILVLMFLCACGKKYTPTKQVSDLHLSLNNQEAVLLLNKNIESANTLGYDQDHITTVHALKSTLVFKNVLTKGKVVRSETIGNLTRTYYEEKRANVEVPYGNISKILGPMRERDSETLCGQGKYLFVLFRESKANIWKYLCIDNKDEVYASLLKLSPNIDIRLPHFVEPYVAE